jgi:hypothetical protein
MLSQNPARLQSGIQERRLMRRFDMRLPAIVRLHPEGNRENGNYENKLENENQNQAQNEYQPNENSADEFQTETQNVSARGVFLYLDRRLPAGTRCEVTLTFPPHITLTDPVRVRFIARVIRSEQALPSLRVGTAAMIENYEFLRSDGGSDLFSALQRKRKPAS